MLLDKWKKSSPQKMYFIFSGTGEKNRRFCLIFHTRLANWQSADGPTGLKPSLKNPRTLLKIVTPPKTPPHTKVSHKNFKSQKQEIRLLGRQKIAFLAPNSQQKQKTSQK